MLLMLFWLMLFDKIDDTNNRAVDCGSGFSRSCCGGGPTFLHDDHYVALAGIYRIESQDARASRRAIRIDGLHQHYPRIFIARIFLRGNNVTKYSGENQSIAPYAIDLT